MKSGRPLDPGREGANAQASLKARLARHCLQLAVGLSLVGLALTGLALWSQRHAEAAATWRDPADDVRPEAIAPDLALASLAGVRDDQVLALAMEANEWETVRALLSLSADLTDRQRVNGWLWLAYRYRTAGQKARAAQAVRLAGDGAILSGQLSGLARAGTLLTVGQRLIELEEQPSARFYLQQAALIGAHAVHLTDYHRQRLLERLVPALLQAGGEREDWLDLAQAAQKGTVQGANLGFPRQAIAPGNDADLVQASDARRSAAAAWLAALSAGQAPTQAVQQSLRQALLDEEAAVEAHLASRNNLAAREKGLRWLMLKRRIANGGAGAGVMPQWESRRAEIDEALAAAWENWLAHYTRPVSVTGAADPRQAANAGRRAIMAAYWGLYPDAPVEELVLMAQAANGSPNRLRLKIVKSGKPPLLGWSRE